MLTEKTQQELNDALNVCNRLRDRLMTDKRPLEERLREDRAIATLMNIAQDAIREYETSKNNSKTGLELFAECLAERRNAI